MILYSEHRLYYAWNALVVVAAVFMAFYVPISLRFDMRGFGILNAIYWLSEVIFVVDAVVQFMRLKKSDDPRSSYRKRLIKW